ncbi:MAG: hypothetical protein WKG07_20215 [Hymenobacter sp.]
MEGQIRYETIRNLFYDNDWSKEIIVTGEGIGATRLRKRLEQAEVVFGDGEERRIRPEPETLLSGASYAGIANAAKAAIAFARAIDDISVGENPLVNYERKNHFHELIDKKWQHLGH